MSDIIEMTNEFSGFDTSPSGWGLNWSATELDTGNSANDQYQTGRAYECTLGDYVTDFFSETTTDHLWFHMEEYTETRNSNFDGDALTFRDVSGNLLISADVSDGNWRINWETGGALVNGYTNGGKGRSLGQTEVQFNSGRANLFSNNKYTGDRHAIDIHFNYDTTEVGSGNFGIDLYIAGVLRSRGIRERNGTGIVQRFAVLNDDYLQNFYSQCILAEFCTVGMRLQTRKPVADGFHTEFDNTPANLNDRSDVTSRSANIGKMSMTHSQVNDETDARVTYGYPHTVAVRSGQFREEVDLPKSINHFFRIDGVDYDGPASIAVAHPSTEWGESRFTTNPATGLGWDWPTLTAAEFGVAI